MKLSGKAHDSTPPTEPQDATPSDAPPKAFTFEDDELRTLKLFVELLTEDSFAVGLKLSAVMDGNGQAQVVESLITRLINLVTNSCRDTNTLKVSKPHNVVNVAPALSYLAQLLIDYQVESGVSVPFVPGEELLEKCLDRYFALREQRIDV